jgi:hypothetical protein
MSGAFHVADVTVHRFRHAPALGGAPPAPPPGKTPLRSLWHLLCAVLNWVLEVLIPAVLKIGPFPLVFGAGTLTPLERMHAA